MEDEDFDRECLSTLVGYSSALRWQMHATSLVIAALGWIGGVPPAGVLGWLLLTTVVREARAAYLLRLDAQHPRPVAPRLRATTLATLALGACYGASALFMARMETSNDAILTMILMSLSAGAVSTSFTVTAAFVAFAAAISIPVALAWLSDASVLAVGVAALVLMFLGVQTRFSRQNLQMFRDSYLMRLRNADLLRQLSQERERLAQARDAAVAADLSKSRFLATASHDLRQPLQSLSLNSAALARMPMEPEPRRVAAEIVSGIDALRQMLDGLLEVSQLDAGRDLPEFGPVPIDRLLLGLAARFRGAAEAKGLTITVQCAPDLVATSDVQRLQRVLSNLIDNAIKYTRQGGVTLACEAQHGRLQLDVRDTGSGIAAEDQQRVFDDLVQLSNPQRDRAFGHGLGLGIVRRLCALLGIELALTSTPGEGTQVRLLLPTGEAASALVANAAPEHPALVARRVVVLDDDAAVRSAYVTALRSMGCIVDGAATLDEAIDATRRLAPEVAVIDHRLAGPEDGLQALAQLRLARPALAALVVTADASPQLRERCAHLGVQMMRKPVSDTVLAQAIHRALGDAVAVPGQGA